MQNGYNDIEFASFLDSYEGIQDHLFVQSQKAMLDKKWNQKLGDKKTKESRSQFQRDFKLIELSEPDWCVYHAKVATRFMCGAGFNKNIQTAKQSHRNRQSSFIYEQKGLNQTTTPTSVDLTDGSHQEVVCKVKQPSRLNIATQ